MRNMPMCPMMMQMQMAQMPMHMQMPMMQPMYMQNMPVDEDEKDEEYFAGMHSESCHKMMPYVLMTVDKMEQKGDMLYVEYPDKEMVDQMTDEAYVNMVKDMPEMSDEMHEERQQFGRRRFARDLLGILLINELLRRRRRRRRRDHGYPGYGYDQYDYYNNDYNDFYYND